MLEGIGLIGCQYPYQIECDHFHRIMMSVFLKNFLQYLVSTVLGCYKPKTFKLYLKDNVKPVFCKPRLLPFTLKDKVSNEIDRLIDEKLLIPVETSDWATPVVPVVKSDGTSRLCGDYKITLNKFLK